MCYSAAAVANAFIDIAHKQNRDITNLQLQKMVYFAHGWYLALTDKPLIGEDFQAWKYGPVVQSLYQALCRYGSGNVTERIPTFSSVDSDSPDYKFLTSVYMKYANYTPAQLVALTHKPNSPWEKAGAGSIPYAVIKQEDIKNFFKAMYAHRRENA